MAKQTESCDSKAWERENGVDKALADSGKFALLVVAKCRKLRETSCDPFLIDRLMESGTVIGLMLRTAERSNDFNEYFGEIKATLRKVDEAAYWLGIMQNTQCIDKQSYFTITTPLFALREYLESFFMAKDIKDAAASPSKKEQTLAQSAEEAKKTEGLSQEEIMKTVFPEQGEK